MEAPPLAPLSSSRRHRRLGNGRRWALAVLLTLVGHVVLLLLLVVLSYVSVKWPAHPERANSRPVSLRNLSGEQWAKNRAINGQRPTDETAQQRPQTEKKEEPKKADERPKGQVVDVAPGNEQKAPDAKFLAEHDNKVQKETRAKETTPFYRNAMPQQTTTTPRTGTGKDNAQSASVAGNHGVGQDDRPLASSGAQGKKMMEVPDVKARQEVAMRDTAAGAGIDVSRHSETEAIRGNSKRFKMQEGSDGPQGKELPSEGHVGELGARNLMPSAATLDKVVGAAPNDHLADVDDGDGTLLNTREWKYSTFFNRVKQAVGMHWNPGESMRDRDPTGNIYSGRDRYTILDVVLTDTGTIKQIKVNKSCGLDFLDSEAVASFERSQPFPNPPPGIVDPDRTVKFQFGFFLEMGGGPRLRLFRPN